MIVVYCIEERPRWKGSRVGNKRKRSIVGWKSVCHGEEEESCGACHWRESVKVTKQIFSIMTAAGEVLVERTPT
jgi:hypothetical protein